MATLSRPLQWQYDTAIRWVNKQLRKTESNYHVEEFEPGETCSYGTCPIGLAFKAAGAVRVNVAPDVVRCWLVPRDDFRIRMMEFDTTKHVAAFIKNYDRGRYKNLIREEKKRGRKTHKW